MPNKLNDLRRLCKLTVVQAVAGFDRGEIDHGNLIVFEFLLVWGLLGIYGAKPGNTAPDPARHSQCLVIARYEQRELGTLLSHIGDLLPEDVDVDIGSRQHNVLELGRKTTVSDCHLA
ncbi:hypothetical protein D3C80_569170 [compost metagenome]